MTIDLERRRVLVVGASGGLGSAAVRAFADKGASVVAAGRPGPALDALRTEAGAEPASLDFLDEGALATFFGNRDAFDHLVIAAASTRTGSVAALPIPDAKASMDSKFWGAYLTARAAKVTDGGSITFISGFLSSRPSAEAVLQGAINAALEALARGLALERAPTRVNCVSPGLIDTPLWSGMSAEDKDAMFQRTARDLPARRVGKPEDIAQAIVFVATNPYVTGTTVTVDGGGTIR